MLVNEKKQNSEHTHSLQLGLNFDGEMKSLALVLLCLNMDKLDQWAQVRNPRRWPSSTTDLYEVTRTNHLR